MKFGEKVRQARIAAGLSQKELAAKAGIALRTVVNYESGERMPKQKETYGQLANVLGLDESCLHDESVDFIIKAGVEYGRRGSEQARKLMNNIIEQVHGLYAGGELEEEDMDEMMRAIQDSYWTAKKNNRKYVPLKYRRNVLVVNPDQVVGKPDLEPGNKPNTESGVDGTDKQPEQSISEKNIDNVSGEGTL